MIRRNVFICFIFRLGHIFSSAFFHYPSHQFFKQIFKFLVTLIAHIYFFLSFLYLVLLHCNIFCRVQVWFSLNVRFISKEIFSFGHACVIGNCFVLLVSDSSSFEYFFRLQIWFRSNFRRGEGSENFKVWIAFMIMKNILSYLDRIFVRFINIKIAN